MFVFLCIGFFIFITWQSELILLQTEFIYKVLLPIFRFSLSRAGANRLTIIRDLEFPSQISLREKARIGSFNYLIRDFPIASLEELTALLLITVDVSHRNKCCTELC